MNLPNLNLFSRKFVSLVITPKHLKAVQVNTKTNNVQKFAQIEIPPGVIVNYKVKDKDALVKLIIQLWSSNKFSEKYVGVVVPEFATYTKAIELPNLTDTEMREALNWTIEEHLPVSVDEVVFDWKLIDRDKQKARVLTVAIIKEVLFQYIDAVAKAGLLPVVVETPSMSIRRVIDKDDTGKLIIYVSISEAILVITSKGEIVATSVDTSGNFQNIVATANQMLSHYASIGIDKVLISGVGLTQDLVQFLNYNLGRSVQYAEVKMNGMVSAQVQDYLIGISMQYKNAVAPESEKTINLLPPVWADYYKKKSQGIKEWSLTLITSAIAWACFLTVFITYMFLSLEVERLKISNGTSVASELNDVATQVREINTHATAVVEFNSKFMSPEAIINSISAAKSDGVEINYFKVNMQTGEINISGNADTRTNLINFKNSLDASGEFSEVHLPITSLISDTNINFDLSFNYNDLIKKPSTKKLNQ